MSERYSILLASKISGVGVHTIRAWEKRYGAITPARNANGRREYEQKEIERLSLLSELCILGHSIGQIAGLETSELRRLLKKIGKQNKFIVENIGSSIVDIDVSLSSLLLALASYKLDIISHEIAKLKLLLSPRDFALKIISPLLVEVGNNVQNKEFSIAQEHALSAILKFHIGHSLFKNYTQKSTKPYNFLIATPEDDYHEFGILQAALLCSHYKLNFFYLGPNMPSQSLLDTYHSIGANRLILGATKSYTSANKDFLNQYLQQMLKGMGKNDLLFFGGTAEYDKSRFAGQRKLQPFKDMHQFDLFLKQL